MGAMLSRIATAEPLRAMTYRATADWPLQADASLL